MRDRILHPEFFTDSKLYDAEKESGLPLRLAYQGLWCVADREGRFEWKPRELKLGILPYDQVDFGEVLQALVRFGFIQRYTVDGEHYCWVRKFKKWQHVHPKEARSKLPEPPSISVVPKEAPDPVNGVPCNSLELPGIPVVSTSTSTFNSTSNNLPPNGGSNGVVKNGSVKKQRASRDTWLTPFSDLWSSGKPPYGQLSKNLKPLVDEHGTEKILEHWRRYLTATDPQFWSPARFQSTWLHWDGSQSSTDQPVFTDEPHYEYLD